MNSRPRDKDVDPISPRARVALLASHDHLLYILPEIPTILSSPVFLDITRGVLRCLKIGCDNELTALNEANVRRGSPVAVPRI